MTLLIEPEVLATLLTNNQLKIIDVRYDMTNKRQGKRAYKNGHIAGAIFADLRHDLSRERIKGITGRYPLPDPKKFAEKIASWGIDRDHHLVIYDDGGLIMAARAWWLFKWIGLKQVSVLHGGMRAWSAAKLPLSTDKPSFQKSSFTCHLGNMPTVDTQTILQDLNLDHLQLIDARSEDAFYSTQKKSGSGHIPGAVNHPFTSNMGDDGRFLPAPYLKKMLKRLISPRRQSVFYCNSGIIACHHILAMEYAGLGTGTLYPGSWNEWIADSSHPVQYEEMR
ncbi:putative thiosulfate sulfurtransferase SseB [invertebrate metagenome]|uniref:Putative thiosulfate sulfurtransferase SseB n=1 Tax=invertebrate metagenome TaxID=1711999 RepID=A0A2H9T8B2_9ZZZZ